MLSGRAKIRASRRSGIGGAAWAVALGLLLLLSAGCAADPTTPAATSSPTRTAGTTIATVDTTTPTSARPPTPTQLTSSTPGSTPGDRPTASATTPAASAGTPPVTTPATPTATTPVMTSATTPATAAVTTPFAQVYVAVECHTANAQLRAGAKKPVGLELPADGVILPTTALAWQEGDTALSVLQRALAQTDPSNVLVKGGAYVEGIGNDAMPMPLYEKDFGSESGWIYYIGGEYVTVGASRRPLAPGESVVWRYTCASGRDLS